MEDMVWPVGTIINTIMTQYFVYQLIHKRFALKRILKYTLKQLLLVSWQTPPSGSALFELAKL
jgi:hypothetical protein